MKYAYVCDFTDKMLKYLQLRVGTGGWKSFCRRKNKRKISAQHV